MIIALCFEIFKVTINIKLKPTLRPLQCKIITSVLNLNNEFKWTNVLLSSMNAYTWYRYYIESPTRAYYSRILVPSFGSYHVHTSCYSVLVLPIQVYSILIVISADSKRFWSPSTTVESNLVGFHVSHNFGQTWYLSRRKQRISTCKLLQATQQYTYAW